MASDNYTLEEVEAIVEGYIDLSEYRHRSIILVRLADLSQAFKRLPQKERQALLLHEMWGLSAEEAGKWLGVSDTAVETRCRSGLERLVNLINGRGR